ncbi:MAG TPA: hypothetical protein PK728_06950 [Bacillota bacterium]|nr:hypothetical protein [Bacillota bacterium]
MRRILDLFGAGRLKNFPGKDQNRRNLWLIGIAALGIFLMVVSGTGKKEAGIQPSRQEASDRNGPGPVKSEMSEEEQELSRKLSEMLGRVEGAGKVEAAVRLASSARSEYAVNTSTGKKTTQERDQSGGTRLITEDTGSDQLVMNKNGTGGEQPVVEQKLAPKVAGVMIVAEGAGNAGVKEKIFEAARVALGVESHRIIVLPMEMGK